MNQRLADLFSLDGRVALVTGASNGIGRRMAEVLAGAGACVVVLARRRHLLDDCVTGIRGEGGAAEALDADLLDLAAIEAIHARASLPFGAPDILVNAAGVNLRLAADAYTRRLAKS